MTARRRRRAASQAQRHDDGASLADLVCGGSTLVAGARKSFTIERRSSDFAIFVRVNGELVEKIVVQSEGETNRVARELTSHGFIGYRRWINV